MTYGKLEKPIDAEPIMELVDNEVRAQQVMNKLKRSGINNNATDKAEKSRNGTIRAYDNTYDTAIKGMNWLFDEYEGKELKKELHKWAKILYRDGRRKLWSPASSFNCHAEGRAYIDFSKAIIEGFKKLPKP